MMKRNLVLAVMLGGCLAASACSSDDDTVAPAGGGSAGTAGSAGSSGHGGSAGSAGSAGHGGSGVGQGGESGGGPIGAGGAEAGAGGAGGETPVGPVFADSLNAHDVLVITADAPALKHLVVAGTDYTKTETAIVTLEPAAVGDRTVFADGDAVAVSSGGLGFVLERTNDKANLLEGGKIKTTFDLTVAGNASDTVTNKAYVTLYNKTLLSVLDLTAGTVAKRIDLTEFDVGDKDGSSEISGQAYDSAKKIAYYVLARIDRKSAVAPDYQLQCTTNKALIVGIDTTTDSIVDLNGAADGKGLELSLAAPESLELSADGKLLMLVGAGCYTGGKLKSAGVEVIDIGTGASTIPFDAVPHADTLYHLNDLLLVGGVNALLQVADTNYAYHWYPLNLSNGTLGVELNNVPSGATYDGKDLLGVKFATVPSVVRYNIGTDSTTKIVDSPWAGTYGTSSGSALVQ